MSTEVVREIGQMAGIGLLAFGINYLSTYQVQKITKKEPVGAAVANSAYILLANVLLYAFVHNPLYAIPEVVGAFFGTLLRVRKDKNEGVR